jgi:hypothetical protein
MASHLGLWEGTSGFGVRRNTMRARFWVEDGRVRGEVSHTEGPTMTVEYLHVST